MNAIESGAQLAEPWTGLASDEEHEPAPSSCVTRRSVLVTLHRGAAVRGPVEMGRLIAHALRAPLHGLVLAPEPIGASEVPDHIGVPAEALHGLVLDIAAGEPLEALASALAAQPAGYVVVSAALEGSATAAPRITSRLASGGRLGLSDVAQRALEIATCGVLLVAGGGPAARLRRVLLPLDGTPSTAAAIAPVCELARSVRAQLDIVLVGEAHPDAAHAPPRLEPGAMIPPLYMDQPHHEWPAFSEEFLQRFVGAIGHCPPGVPTRLFLGAGEPAAEILRLTGELQSDLVVLVWHGELSEQHGGVFGEVVRNARCPVLVLRR
jgi:nucleotide-binding universal stress UspA family protein